MAERTLTEAFVLWQARLDELVGHALETSVLAQPGLLGAHHVETHSSDRILEVAEVRSHSPHDGAGYVAVNANTCDGLSESERKRWHVFRGECRGNDARGVSLHGCVLGGAPLEQSAFGRKQSTERALPADVNRLSPLRRQRARVFDVGVQHPNVRVIHDGVESTARVHDLAE